MILFIKIIGTIAVFYPLHYYTDICLVILLTSVWCISELGANIAGAKEDEQESGVPSTNSIKSMNAYRNSASTELRSQIDNVEEENVRYESRKLCHCLW